MACGTPFETNIRDMLERIELRTTQAIAAGRDVTHVGAFLAAIHPTSELVWLNFAVPRSTSGQPVRAQDIASLRALFRARGRRLRFEFYETLWADLGRLLERCGLVLEGRMPLMLCSPGSFRDSSAPQVRVDDLTAEAGDPEIAEFLATGKRGFGLEAAQVEPHEIAEQRRHLRDGVYRCAYGRVEGRMVGVGTLAAGNDELAGIATLPAARRRGVAATISCHLVRRHFQAGNAYVWLSAGDDAARAVYEKIGFRAAGTQLNYVDPPDR